MSLFRGHDIRGGVLIAYGGAAGQLACRLAEALGLHEVLLHPLGGVLSAYGIGQARQRQLHQRAIRRPLDADLLKRLPSMLRADLGSATDALRREGRGSAAAVDHQIRLELRDASSEQGLMLNLETSPEGLALHALEDQFDRAHRQRFGYVASRTASLMAERLEVEVLETQPLDDGCDAAAETEEARPRQQLCGVRACIGERLDGAMCRCCSVGSCRWISP